jgi:hypothetical protein
MFSSRRNDINKTNYELQIGHLNQTASIQKQILIEKQ